MAEKYRYWACILYPDDPFFPDDLDDILSSLHIDFILSPLHDSDKNPDRVEAGYETHKKRHRHLIICWNGPTTYNAIKTALSLLGPNVTNPFPVYQVNGYIRYLIHFDNPEKQQFENGKNDIKTFGRSYELVEEAFDIGDYDKVKITKEICDYIRSNYVSEFTHLLTYASNNEPKWAYLLYKHVPDAVKLTLNSIRYGYKRQDRKGQEDNLPWRTPDFVKVQDIDFYEQT